MLVGEALIVAANYPPTVPELVAFLLAVYSVAAFRGLAVGALGGVLALIGLATLKLR